MNTNLDRLPSKALVIDDNELESQLIDLLLSSQGIDVCLVNSEVTANAALDVFKPNIVIASWRVGQINGRAVTCRLKANHPRLIDIPGLLITDRKLTFQQRMECTREGFNWIVQTPFTPDNFAKLVGFLITESTVPGVLKRKPTEPIPQCSDASLIAVGEYSAGGTC